MADRRLNGQAERLRTEWERNPTHREAWMVKPKASFCLTFNMMRYSLSNMQLIGAHMSIAGGVFNAILRGDELGCTAIQIFPKNARRLFEKPLDKTAVAKWNETLAASRYVKSVIAHSGYLINLAAEDDEKWERYIEAMMDEMARCDVMGIKYIALHPGSPGDMGEEFGIRRVASAIDIIYDERNFAVDIALETTAGTGHHLGWRFEHLRNIMDNAKHGNRLKVIFDTCHTFAAGYDFTSESGYCNVWKEFDEIIGFERLVAMHINDSKYPPGSRKDRHEHIGKGFLGIKPFEMIMQDEKLIKIPKILETPKEDDWDRKNLRLLWELSGEDVPDVLK